ncbi:metallophosphoesterase family protein [Maribacter sp. 2307ULW6-5]|uniref:metallophosphoesterase family protein n=1 Tax=Maribacter sp. 2307ULW6-5 TaxID=3386275 RepID=UPI0039BD6068
MKNNNGRRAFIGQFAAAATLITSTGVKNLWAAGPLSWESDVALRFVVASDAHYGQPKTPYRAMAKQLVRKLNAFHDRLPVAFCVLNGDIIHDDPKFMPKAQKRFSKLRMPVYATQGNHDRIPAAQWEAIWGTPVNHRIDVENQTMLLMTTSNEVGEYLSPDLQWLEGALEASSDQNVFLFLHIPQKKWTEHAIDTPALFQLLSAYPQVKAIFHGHEHEEDGIYMEQGLPCIFDSHVGGSWGTAYRGFRVVEVLENGNIITYMMDPDKEISRDTLV